MPTCRLDAHLERTTCWSYAFHRIERGDLLLYRHPRSPIALAARLAGEEFWYYSHAAMAEWHAGVDHQTLCNVDSRQFIGGRIVTLHSQVKRLPGVIDVWRPRTSVHIRELAAQYAFDQAGHEYNWRGIAACGARWLPGVSRISESWSDVGDMSLSEWEAPKFCSQQAAWSYRKAALSEMEPWAEHPNWDPCWYRGDPHVWPHHLANSSFDLLYPRLVLDEDEDVILPLVRA